MTYRDTDRVLQEVIAERARQVGQLGYTEQHDDEHGEEHVMKQAHQRFERMAEGVTPTEARAELVKIAALAVAAIETMDRRRGYDAILKAVKEAGPE